jgi:threonine dehydrogenase-like Zn-dependent dehydrogenase
MKAIQAADRGGDIVIDALGGPFTGQAVGGLARGGRVVVMGYSAGTVRYTPGRSLSQKRLFTTPSA